MYAEEENYITATMIAGFEASLSGTYIYMLVFPGLLPKFDTWVRLAAFAIARPKAENKTDLSENIMT